MAKLIAKRVGRTDNKEYKLKLKYYGGTFDFYFSDYSDFVVLKEVFLDEEYDTTLKKEPKIIFDLGSHVGASVIYFRLRYPNAQIFAFEPAPEAFAKLEKNTGHLDGISAFNIAVAGKDGEEKFYVHTEDTVSSSLKQRVPGQPYLEVICKTLDTLVADLGITQIDLLKIDIEGGEYEVLKGFTNIDIANFIIGELHLDLINRTKEQFFDMLNGFTVTKRTVASDRYIFTASRY